MSHYVLSKVIQIEMDSRQTCYCSNDFRLYAHSLRKTAALTVKGSAHLYLEIVRVVSLFFFQNSRFTEIIRH